MRYHITHTRMAKSERPFITDVKKQCGSFFKWLNIVLHNDSTISLLIIDPKEMKTTCYQKICTRTAALFILVPDWNQLKMSFGKKVNEPNVLDPHNKISSTIRGTNFYSSNNMDDEQRSDTKHMWCIIFMYIKSSNR